MTARRAVVLALLTSLWCYAAWQTRAVDSDRPTSLQTPPRQPETGMAQPAWEAPEPRTVKREASRSRQPSSTANARLNWAALFQCESSGNPRAVSPSGKYRGLYQMDADFWRTYGGRRFASRPDLATSAQQTLVARRGYEARGRRPWPTCGARL